MTTINHQTKLTKGHPIHTYLLETSLIYQLLQELSELDPKEDFQKFYNIFNHLATVEKRFQRKENQLFPFLEQKGWTGPSQNMWSFHDTIREIFRLIRKNLNDKDFTSVRHSTGYLKQNLNRLLDVENDVLFPNSLEMLEEEDWIKMRAGEEKLAGCLLQT